MAQTYSGDDTEDKADKTDAADASTERGGCPGAS